jgi:hypothetical protein
MRLSGKIYIGIIILLLGFNTVCVIGGIQEQITLNKATAQSELDYRFYYLNKQIEAIKIAIDRNSELLDNKINNNANQLNQKLIDLPNVEKYKKQILEYKLQQVNVEIINKTAQAQGSGVTLKYKGKFYILSAGHMLNDITDELVLCENGVEICMLEVVKLSHTFLNNEPKGTDLVLLKPKDPLIQPKVYVEFAEEEPSTPAEIYIVGNPLGMEDVLTDGRIISYFNDFVYFIDHSYFGNSGGGIYTKDGKLVGIVSHMAPIQPNPNIPPYMIHGAQRLNVILQFLQGIE